jgi:hypothetical protein
MTTIRGHVIAGNFIIDTEPNEDLSTFPHVRVPDTVGPYIDYLFITFDRIDNQETDVSLVIRDRGCDMQDRGEEIFFKKIQPITCQGIFPELDSLLSAMIKDEVSDVLFYPFKTRKYGSAYMIRDNWIICLSGHITNIKFYYHCLENDDECAKESFVRQGRRGFEKTHLDNIINPDIPMRGLGVMSEQIEFPLNTARFGGRYSNEVLRRYGAFVSDITIRINWTEHSLYKNVIKLIRLLVGGMTIANLPPEFLELYYRYVSGFSPENLRNNKTSFYPINLKKIFGISSIALWRLDHHQVRIETEFNDKNVLDYDGELPDSEICKDYCGIYCNFQYTSDNDEIMSNKIDDVFSDSERYELVSAIRSIYQLESCEYRVESNKIIIPTISRGGEPASMEWILVSSDGTIEPECRFNGTTESEKPIHLEIEPEFIKAVHQPEQGRYLVMENCNIDGEIVLTSKTPVNKVSVFFSTKKYVTYYDGMMW